MSVCLLGVSLGWGGGEDSAVLPKESSSSLEVHKKAL